MTGSVAGIRRRRTVAGRRETPHLPPDRGFYGQTLLRNEKLSKQHTYVSKKVSILAEHAKKISWPQFEAHYKPNLGKALESAKSFAVTEVDLLDLVGTMMPALVDKILKPRAT